MLGIIYRTGDDRGFGSLPIAGKPLAVRQLQYLRALGVTRVALEHPSSLTGDELAAWLVDEALTAGLELVSSHAPLGATEVARRAHFPANERFIALPSNALFDADVKDAASAVVEGRPIRLRAAAPLALAKANGAFIDIAAQRTDLDAANLEAVACGGWGVTLESGRDALMLGAAALDGTLSRNAEGLVWPVQIHASERTPGIWVARGASIAADATLVAPVLVGANVIVRSRAKVGPCAILGDGSVIEARAHIERAIVLADTVVGEGMKIVDIAAGPGAIEDLDTDSRFDVEDDAMLAPRQAPYRAAFVSRLIAMVMVVASLPLASLFALLEVARGRAIAHVTRRRIGKRAVELLAPTTSSLLLSHWLLLLDVARGRRALVGVHDDPFQLAAYASRALVADASRALPGAFSIERALSLPKSSPESRLHGFAWYGVAKSFRTDIALLWRALTNETSGLETLEDT